MLGLKIPENFKSPYLSSSPSSFWRNWHITLSSWIRDYLYSFLVSRLPRACFGFLPLCLTWCLMGLWHGPSWMFIFWGFLNSIFILCYRLIKSIFAGASNLNPFFFLLTGWFFTFIFIMSSWIFFRSNSWDQASYLYLLLFSPITGFTLHLRENYYLIVFLFSVSTLTFGIASRVSFFQNILSRPILLSPLMMIVLSFSLLFLNRQQSFLYFAF